MDVISIDLAVVDLDCLKRSLSEALVLCWKDGAVAKTYSAWVTPQTLIEVSAALASEFDRGWTIRSHDWPACGLAVMKGTWWDRRTLLVSRLRQERIRGVFGLAEAATRADESLRRGRLFAVLHGAGCLWRVPDYALDGEGPL